MIKTILHIEKEDFSLHLHTLARTNAKHVPFNSLVLIDSYVDDKDTPIDLPDIAALKWVEYLTLVGCTVSNYTALLGLPNLKGLKSYYNNGPCLYEYIDTHDLMKRRGVSVDTNVSLPPDSELTEAPTSTFGLVNWEYLHYS